MPLTAYDIFKEGFKLATISFRLWSKITCSRGVHFTSCSNRFLSDSYIRAANKTLSRASGRNEHKVSGIVRRQELPVHSGELSRTQMKVFA